VFPWLTVKQNIAFGLTLAANRAEAAERDAICDRYMRLMGLSEFADAWPKMLSGGMRQRLALARAYAVRPQFLLMDEPFGALDEMTRERMNAELLGIWEASGSTVVFVTHSIAEAVFLSTRIVVMSARPGRISRVIPVDLPQPRGTATREDARFFELATEVREALHLGGHLEVPA
jgi:NitT/TauT family transport system ATP-binding protein